MVDVETLAAEIERRWDLTAVEIVDARVSYPTRGVFHLTSDRGEFAAKVFADLSADDVSASVRTLLEVTRSGYAHAPNLVSATSGHYVEMTGVGAVLLMEFLPVILNKTDTVATWEDLGSALGILNTLDGRRPFAIPVEAALREQVDRTNGTAFESGVGRLVERLTTLTSARVDGVIHGEANPSNAGRRATGELVLLDWDQAGTATTALEYGYPLITCHVSESRHVDEEAITAFYGAYQSTGSHVDRSLAIDAALFHALRYMWFANTEARWERIEFVLGIERDLIGLIP